MEAVVGDKKERGRDVRVKGFFYTSWAGLWLTRSYISLFVTPELVLAGERMTVILQTTVTSFLTRRGRHHLWLVASG